MLLAYRTGSLRVTNWTDEEEQFLSALISLLQEYPERRMLTLKLAIRSLLEEA